MKELVEGKYCNHDNDNILRCNKSTIEALDKFIIINMSSKGNPIKNGNKILYGI